MSKVSLANMFSYMVGSLSVLLVFSLDLQKLFSLMYIQVLLKTSNEISLLLCSLVGKLWEEKGVSESKKDMHMKSKYLGRCICFSRY